MRLLSYGQNGRDALGLLIGEDVYPVSELLPGWLSTMNELLDGWDRRFDQLRLVEAEIKEKGGGRCLKKSLSNLTLLPPVPRPGSCRDGYAFRQHVEAARRNRGLGMIPAFDKYPIFYFTNHRTVQGPGEVVCMPDHFRQLDFELEVAVTIAKEGKNIRAADADSYIGGLMIMNDWSARTLQLEEMLLNLGPAKGKDFATSIGPWLVTPDELEALEVPCKRGHTGKAWNLSMEAFVNGVQTSAGNLADMDWTFAEIIERASYGVTLYPGDVIGSGTVGTGCFLELNGTAKLADPGYTEQWLKQGDSVELRVERLGSLVNTVVCDKSNFSILDLQSKYK